MTLRLLCGLAALLCCGAAFAEGPEERFDHRGSVGLLVAAGPQFLTVQLAKCPACDVSGILSGVGGALDVGGTLAVGHNGNELGLRLRLERLPGQWGGSLYFGPRTYFGRDRLKSLLSVELALNATPALMGGVRGAAGIMYELSPVLGAFAEGALGLGLGQGRRLGGELLFGLQARSYLLE